MKKLIALAVSLAVTGTANAAWQTGGAANSDGELMLTVWNTVTETAFSQDLGVLARQAMTGALATQTFSLDAGGLAHVGGPSADLKWSVVGASYSFDSGVEGYGWYMTSNSGAPGNLLSQPAISGFSSVLNTYDNNLGNPSASSDANPVVLTSAAVNGISWAGLSWGNSAAGVAPQYGLGGTSFGDNATAEAYSMAYVLDVDFNFIPTNTLDLNFWNLNATNGELIYGASTSAVPVPAAAWLFGSALISLVGIGRNRKS